MLNDEESSKLALSEAAKKVSDLKARQWEISKNAVVILAFLAAVFHGDLKYALLQMSNGWKYLVLSFYFAYFCSIFWQAFSNTNRYKGIYKKAADLSRESGPVAKPQNIFHLFCPVSQLLADFSWDSSRFCHPSSKTLLVPIIWQLEELLF